MNHLVSDLIKFKAAVKLLMVKVCVFVLIQLHGICFPTVLIRESSIVIRKSKAETPSRKNE